MIEIASIKTHLKWLDKLLGGLGILCLAAFAWIFYNIYQPVQDIRKDVAVQTTILGEIKDDLKSLKENPGDWNADPKGSGGAK